ncbi:hypothetical protein H8876_03815 [Clostridiales Family XIII bacterium BX16]|uniref:Uncharacterized protein n=1 Tax=Lentihominibacter faecis TaxID=2764712 RepID=A0A923SR76_9FIRM|nr:hypothetical protein [Lentihominibacter faecis]MBC5999125.1 hypothetical protein [Lentihominibacter faecis]
MYTRGLQRKNRHDAGAVRYFRRSRQRETYYACIIQDALACCTQGLEFVLAGEHTYPDDYPKEGEEITVTGIFDTYEEDGFKYCQLINASMEQ